MPGGSIQLVGDDTPVAESISTSVEKPQSAQPGELASTVLSKLSKLIADGKFDGVGLGSFKPVAERQVSCAYKAKNMKCCVFVVPQTVFAFEGFFLVL